MTEPERIILIGTLLNAAAALNLRVEGQDASAFELISDAFDRTEAIEMRKKYARVHLGGEAA